MFGVLIGASKLTMFRLLKRWNIATYRDPRDARTKLLKVEDVERLIQPVPIEPEGKAAA